jgi:hypothetical protein
MNWIADVSASDNAPYERGRWAGPEITSFISGSNRRRPLRHSAPTPLPGWGRATYLAYWVAAAAACRSITG